MSNANRIYPDWEKIDLEKPTEAEVFLLKLFDSKLNPNVEIFYKPNINSLICDIILLKENCGAVIVECELIGKFIINSNGECILVEDNRAVEPPYIKVQGIKEVLINSHFQTMSGQYKQKNHLIKPFSFLYDKDNLNLTKFTTFCGQLEEYSIDDGIDKINQFFTQTNDNFTNEDYKDIRRLVKPSLHRIEDGIELELTADQKKIINNKQHMIKVKGVAGSGKTVILARKAVELHKLTKQNVLILTFNITLRNFIKSEIKKVRETFYEHSITVIHYHEFIRAQSAKYAFYKNRWQSYDETQHFNNISDIKRYHSILIDEVQDYKPGWLINIQNNFLEENGYFIVFGDSKQNIYGREEDNFLPKIPGVPGRWNILNSTIRLNPEIAYIATKYQEYYFKTKAPEKIESEFGNEQGELGFNLLEIQNRIRKYNADKLVQDIFTIARDREMNHNDICIIFAGGSCDDVHKKLSNKYHIEHTEMCAGDDQTKRPKKLSFVFNTGTIKLATVQSFKGWGASHIFLIVVPTTLNSAELVYTGITRTKKDLIIFNCDPKYQDFFDKYLSTEYNFEKQFFGVTAKISSTEKLKTVFNKAFRDFRTFSSDRCSVNFNDFRKNNYDNSNYLLKSFQQAYILKYFYAYFLDYKILYAKLLDKFPSINKLNILSAGCGCGIDFLALIDCLSEKKLDETINLNYLGIDTANWNYIPVDYNKFKFTHKSISEIEASSLSYVNVIFFPRSLSDIESNALTKFSKLFNSTCRQETVYIIAAFVSLSGEPYGLEELYNNILRNMTNFSHSTSQEEIEHHDKLLKVLDYPQDVWGFTSNLSDFCEKDRKKECMKECKFLPMTKVSNYSSHQIIELKKNNK